MSTSSAVFPPPSQTRLVTIIAHVDHGKTTLADNLIESNGIISERLAGTLRYLDSMEEEQRRGITMRTSAIGLRHTHRTKKSSEEMVIHLLDSPGHTDFAPEVSSSLQLCDGALLVVDAVEGMCARTHQVLREAHSHQLVPLLVINKIDRICTDLCLSPAEAYLRLRHLLESINAASAAMLTAAAEMSTEELNEDEETEEEKLWTFDPMKGNVIFASALYGWGFTVPSLARSLFRSKILPIKPPILRQYLFGDYKYKDGKILKWKANSDAEPLFAEYGLQPLWDMYEGVASAAAAAGLPSELFADGRARTTAMGTSNGGKGDPKIKSDLPGMDRVLSAMAAGGGTSSTQIPSTPAELQKILNQTGASAEESVLRCLLRRYRPLSDAVLDAVCEQCPDPSEAANSVRTRALALQQPPHVTEDFQRIQHAVSQCDVSIDAPAVAHICKFMATDRSNVTDPDLPSVNGDSEDGSNNLILGLARVLSGNLRADETNYYLFGPKYQPHEGEAPPQRSIRLYLLMGSSFVRVSEVPAGHLCAIYDLENLQLKTVTLCSQPDGMPLQGFDRGIRPLVKVNVEPVSAADTDALERGLMKLSLADAAVEVTATSKGERILACLGEVHLEQSILDLETVYCGKEMKLRISDPIVEFAETTKWFDNEMDYEAVFDDQSPPLRQVRIPPYCEEEGIGYANHGRMRAILSGRGSALCLRVVPLAQSVFSSLQQSKVVEGSEEELTKIGRALRCGVDIAEDVLSCLSDALCALDGNGNALLEAKGVANGQYVKGVTTASGEVYVPPSHLEKETEGEEGNVDDGKKEYDALRERVWEGGLLGLPAADDAQIKDAVALNIWKSEMQGSAVAGFQLAMRYGPVCEEPVRGTMVIIESVEIALKPQSSTENGGGITKPQNAGSSLCTAKPLSGGMVVSGLRSGIRCSLLTRPVRLMERVFLLTLHSSLAGLGPLYAVLSKRRGKVLTDSMVDGTDLLLITATLPQAESFGLAPELLGKTSGEVTIPELVFSHWELLDEDPFWIPTSLEEREDFGEIIMNGDSSTGLDNTALKYIRLVRDRKGLLVDSSRTVIAAEKQRTLKR